MKFSIIKIAAISLALLVSSKASSAIISVESFLDGNTASTGFNLTSSASNTMNIASFSFDVSSIGLVFDTVVGGAYTNGNVRPFTPTSSSDVTTGLVSPYDVTDGATSFTIFFTDFNPGEIFTWKVDLDFFSGAQRVNGHDLIGATLKVEFEDGSFLSVVYNYVSGNSDASELAAVNVSEPHPATLVIVSILLISLRKLRF